MAKTQVFLVGCPPVGGWPGGTYYPDGTGGKYTAVPEARRCGVGLARLKDQAHEELAWGLYCALPGFVQTVPRAELYAVVLLVVRVVPGEEVWVVSDCLPVVRGIHARRRTGKILISGCTFGSLSRLRI